MEEEIFDPQMREKIIDRWYACSELLLYRLMVKGVPIYTGCHAKNPGINILKVHYKKRAEKSRQNGWKTNSIHINIKS